MLVKIYLFGILLNIITLIFVRIDLKLFKYKYSTEEKPFELQIKIVFIDLWTVLIPLYNIMNSFYLYYQVSQFKATILKELNPPNQ